MTEENKEVSQKKDFPIKINLRNIFMGLSIVLGIILIINIFFTFNISKELQKDIESAKEKVRAAKIELTLIENSRCTDCSDVTPIMNSIKKNNVNITKEKIFEFDSDEAKEIISKYNIQRVPSVIITGEINKTNIQGLEKKDTALVLTKIEPPYTNAKTGRIEGRVTLSLLTDSECTECSNLSNLISQFKGAGIKISEQKNILASSDEGKELIKKYNIGFVPTIILSKDAELYAIMQKAWSQVGTKEKDGSYVFRRVQAIGDYKDLVKNQVVKKSITNPKNI